MARRKVSIENVGLFCWLTSVKENRRGVHKQEEGRNMKYCIFLQQHDNEHESVLKRPCGTMRSWTQMRCFWAMGGHKYHDSIVRTTPVFSRQIYSTFALGTYTKQIHRLPSASVGYGSGWKFYTNVSSITCQLFYLLMHHRVVSVFIVELWWDDRYKEESQSTVEPTASRPFTKITPKTIKDITKTVWYLPHPKIRSL